MRAQRSWYAAPSSVSATSREVRWSSRAPTRASSLAILRLTVDVGTPSARAALTKLPSLATRAKRTISLRSIMRGIIPRMG